MDTVTRRRHGTGPWRRGLYHRAGKASYRLPRQCAGEFTEAIRRIYRDSYEVQAKTHLAGRK